MKEGKPIAATHQHLVFLPASGKDFPTIIAMHGRGADENDLASVLLSLEIPKLLLVTPRAPFALPYGGYEWYKLAQEGVPDPETFRTSLELVRKFVDQVTTGYPADPAKVIIMGFSQGAVMAYAVALINPLRFRGVAALSGYVPHKSDLPLRLNELAGVPIFISHGSNDTLIPVHFGREAARLLTEAGANVKYHEYLTGHEVTETTLRDLKEWFLKVVATI